jgi:hypothetical protein
MLGLLQLNNKFNKNYIIFNHVENFEKISFSKIFF